jgi:hypothetical protein
MSWRIAPGFFGHQVGKGNLFHMVLLSFVHRAEMESAVTSNPGGGPL